MSLRSETRLAVLEMNGKDRLEIRVKPGAFFDLVGISELIAERRRLAGNTPVGVLLVLPNDVDLDPVVVSVNHYADPEIAKGLRALAVVVDTTLLETMFRLFLAYYPPRFSSGIFRTKTEARNWLSLELEKPVDQP
ncbi:MAG: hypothetical protein IPO90_13500 [Flavobacteriales bacterium]|nr:hypothetical protein [Flavobacteriales bacterium]